MVKDEAANPSQLRGLCFLRADPGDQLLTSSPHRERWECHLQETPEAGEAPCLRWHIGQGWQERRRRLHFLSLGLVVGSGCAEAGLGSSVLEVLHHFWCGEGLQSSGNITLGAHQPFNTVWDKSKKICLEKAGKFKRKQELRWEFGEV